MDGKALFPREQELGAVSRGGWRELVVSYPRRSKSFVRFRFARVRSLRRPRDRLSLPGKEYVRLCVKTLIYSRFLRHQSKVTLS